MSDLFIVVCPGQTRAWGSNQKLVNTRGVKVNESSERDMNLTVLSRLATCLPSGATNELISSLLVGQMNRKPSSCTVSRDVLIIHPTGSRSL